jgi:hypothetical protein
MYVLMCVINSTTGTGWGPRELSRYSDSLRAGRSGDRIPVGARFSAPVHTVPEGPLSLLYNGYRVFTGGKAAGGVVLTTHPHLAQRLKEE